MHAYMFKKKNHYFVSFSYTSVILLRYEKKIKYLSRKLVVLDEMRSPKHKWNDKTRPVFTCASILIFTL